MQRDTVSPIQCPCQNVQLGFIHENKTIEIPVPLWDVFINKMYAPGEGGLLKKQTVLR